MSIKSVLKMVNLVGFLVLFSFAQAESSASGLMVRSSQTLKFEAAQSGSADFAARKGHFQKVQAENGVKNASKSQQGTQANSFAVASEFIESQNAYKLTVTGSNNDHILISDQP